MKRWKKNFIIFMVKRPTIVLTYPIHARAIREDLAPRARVRIAKNPRELRAFVKTADALITRFSDSVDAELLAQAPRLRVVGNFAVGVDNIDLRACAVRKIRVVNTPRVLSRATAELTLALLLAAARRIPEGEALCRSGKFRGWAPDLLLGQELRGRHAVLVGKGRIGQETARLFQGIGITTEWITRGDSSRAINQKLRRAEILSLHVPLTRQTRHWLDSRRLSKLPREAIVLNTTRGPVVNEAALIRALQSRRIFAAGLDVYEREPEIPPALRKLPNVVLLPHLGSATEETREAMARLVIAGVLRILSGKGCWNEVNCRDS